MAKYSTQTKVEGELKRSLTTEELVNFDDLVENISGAVSGSLHRVWNDIVEESGEEEAETSKIFDGNGSRELFIDDFQSISKIELLDYEGAVYETIEDEDDFILYPLNATTKDSIVLRSYLFPRGQYRVKITGVWSGALPKPISLVVTKLIANYISNNESNGAFSQESIEGYSYTLKNKSDVMTEQQTLMDSISHYRKILL